MISHNTLYTSKRFIRFTKKSKEEYEKGTLVIPFTTRKKKIPTRLRKSILLILSIAAFGYFKWKRVYQDESLSKSIVKSSRNKGFMYFGGKRIPGVAINDIVSNLKNKGGAHKHRAPPLENQINITNMGLFGYLELTKEEAKKSIEFLTHQLPILIETKYHNQTRYIIKDKELKEFIKTCIILFCKDVYSILECLYSLIESRLRDRQKKEIEHFERFPSSYPKTSKEERLSQINQYIKSLEKSSFYDYRLKRNPTFDNKGQQPDQINTFQEWMREIWFGKDKASIHFDFIKEDYCLMLIKKLKELLEIYTNVRFLMMSLNVYIKNTRS